MIGIKLAAITSVASLLIGGGIGWTARDWKADSDALEAKEQADEAYLKATKQAYDAGVGYEASRSANNAQSIETRTIIEREYRNVEVPAQCAIPEPVADSLQRSIDTANGKRPSQPNSAVRGDTGPSPTGD